MDLFTLFLYLFCGVPLFLFVVMTVIFVLGTAIICTVTMAEVVWGGFNLLLEDIRSLGDKEEKA